MKTFNQFFESSEDQKFVELVRNFKNLVGYFVRENKIFDEKTIEFDISERYDKFGNLHASIKCPILSLNEEQMPIEDYQTILADRTNLINRFDGFFAKFYNKFDYMPFINIEETPDKGTIFVFTVAIEELYGNQEMHNFLTSDNTIKKFSL